MQVWAVDLWFSPRRTACGFGIAGVEDGVFPTTRIARTLPLAAGSFELLILPIDHSSPSGLDDLYLSYLARFVKSGWPGGQWPGPEWCKKSKVRVLDHFQESGTQEQTRCLHSAAWWQRSLGAGPV